MDAPVAVAHPGLGDLPDAFAQDGLLNPAGLVVQSGWGRRHHPTCPPGADLEADPKEIHQLPPSNRP